MPSIRIFYPCLSTLCPGMTETTAVVTLVCYVRMQRLTCAFSRRISSTPIRKRLARSEVRAS